MKIDPILPPALDHDAKNPPGERQLLERTIVANLVHYLEHHGFHPYRVFDGEEYVKTLVVKDVLEAVFSVDESRLHVRKGVGRGHTIVIILGNGVDCISDHSVAPYDEDQFEAVMNEFDPEQYPVVQPPTKEVSMSIQAMIAVQSSTIKAVGHDVVNSSMIVEFMNGSRYSYENVDRNKFDSIVNAESVGKAFDREIKKQADLHPFKKVD